MPAGLMYKAPVPSVKRSLSRRSKSSGARRSLKKKGGNGRPGDMIIYKGIGMPDKLLTKLKYVMNTTLTAGLGTEYKQYQFRGNSCYDPDLTGSGDQPEYFDQLCAAAAVYTQYLVYASKIKIRASATGDSFAIGNVDFCVTPSQTVFASTGWVDIDDQIASKMTKTNSVVRYDNAGVKYLTHYARTDKILDIKDTDDNLSACAGAYNGNPTAPWYWIIGQQGMDRASTTASVNYRVEITYYVRLFNLSDRPLS